MDGRPVVVVIEDDEATARAVAFHLRDWPIVNAYTCAQAEQVIDTVTNVCLAIVDLNLPDSLPFNPADPEGSSFRIASRVRQKHPAAALVIFSGMVDAALLNATHRLGAEYVHKENSRDNLILIAERLRLADRAGNWRTAEAIERLGATSGLSRRQTEVAALAAQSLGIAEIAKRMGLSVNTVKYHVRAILEKTGESNLRSLVRKLA